MLMHGPQNVAWNAREQNRSTKIYGLRKVNRFSRTVVVTWGPSATLLRLQGSHDFVMEHKGPAKMA